MEGSSSIATSCATEGELVTAQPFVPWSMTTVDDVFVSPDASERYRAGVGRGPIRALHLRGETVKRVSLIGRNSGGPLCRSQ
jgi:hypothetical protein